MAQTYNFNDLNQARTSNDLSAYIKKHNLTFDRGFKLGSGDKEIDVAIFKNHGGCFVVDNAGAGFTELSFNDTIDLLNTDDLHLSAI